MNEKNVHRHIEAQDAQAKENLRKMTEEKLGFSLSQHASPESERKTNKMQKYCAVFATAVCVVCLLIALPFLLKDNTQPDNPYRFCKEEDGTMVWSEHNLAEYNQQNGTNLLYIDYKYVAETETQICISKDDETDIIYFYEKLYVEDTYDEIILYITDNRTTVDILEEIEISCENSVSVNDTLVHWRSKKESGAAVFEYQDYRYFIVLQYPAEENTIMQFVSSMLEK